MSYWVEVHCDTTQEERDKIPLNSLGQVSCETDRAESPGALGRNLQVAGSAARNIARARGWRKKGNRNFMCPMCLKYAFKRGEKKDG